MNRIAGNVLLIAAVFMAFILGATTADRIFGLDREFRGEETWSTNFGSLVRARRAKASSSSKTKKSSKTPKSTKAPGVMSSKAPKSTKAPGVSSKTGKAGKSEKRYFY